MFRASGVVKACREAQSSAVQTLNAPGGLGKSNGQCRTWGVYGTTGSGRDLGSIRMQSQGGI